MRMKDIADKLGLSIATVSRVVNKHSNVNEKTKEKVLNFIKEVGYTPNIVAQSLSKRESKTIAVLVPNIINPFFAALINSISKRFIKEGYQITLYNTVGDLTLEEKAIKSILGQKVAAVIAILNDGEYEVDPLKVLCDRKIDVYLLDRDIKEGAYAGVFIDNYSGAYKITEELLKKGHKNIAIITGNLRFLNAKERLRGFKDALKDNGIDILDEDIYKGDYLFESGYRLATDILKKNYTALFSSNNLMLYGFLKAFKKSKQNIEFACFEKTEFLDILDLDIKTLEVPFDKIAKEMYGLFNEKAKHQKIYVEPKLYIERSR